MRAARSISLTFTRVAFGPEHFAEKRSTRFDLKIGSAFVGLRAVMRLRA